MELPNIPKPKETIVEIVDEIHKMNDWYKQHFSNTTIELLAKFRSKMNTYLESLGWYVGNAKGYYKSAESASEYEYAKKRLEFRAVGETILASTDKSKIENKPNEDEANKADEYYTTLKYLIDQNNKTVEGINQDIAIMRKEKENAR
jgi:hypothetical protein